MKSAKELTRNRKATRAQRVQLVKYPTIQTTFDQSRMDEGLVVAESAVNRIA
jgi:hypothetical protein